MYCLRVGCSFHQKVYKQIELLFDFTVFHFLLSHLCPNSSLSLSNYPFFKSRFKCLMNHFGGFGGVTHDTRTHGSYVSTYVEMYWSWRRKSALEYTLLLLPADGFCNTMKVASSQHLLNWCDSRAPRHHNLGTIGHWSIKSSVWSGCCTSSDYDGLSGNSSEREPIPFFVFFGEETRVSMQSADRRSVCFFLQLLQVLMADVLHVTRAPGILVANL